MIEVRNISKRYGSQKAVEDVSFCVNEGEILGFLGPNGAGKSTVMNIITGYISSTSGKVLVDGKDIVEAPAYAKKQMGYLPEIPPLYEDMTVKEYLYFIYDLKKCKLPKISHMKDICSLVGIDDVYSKVIKNLSKGYKQRVGFAQALVGDPKILILDEPTVGLDPRQIAEIRSLIKKLGKKHTVILSSHILPEIQAVCDRIIIINKGQVAADGTAEEIAKNITNEHKMTLRVEGPTRSADDKKTITDAIRSITGVKYVRADMEREKGVYDYDIETDGKTDIRRALNKLCADNGWNILMLQLSDLTLEDIFLKITMDEGLGKSDSGKSKSKPKIEIKTTSSGKLRAVQEEDEEEDDEATSLIADSEETNGGEE
jgi:ABC-2 type transport system ATP-binding protein